MESLLSEIEKFMTAHQMAPTRFGEEALKDRRFVKQLRKGRRVWPETAQRVRDFMVSYRPASTQRVAAPERRAAA